MNGMLYIAHLPGMDEDTYKIGKTKRLINDRLLEYPYGTTILKYGACRCCDIGEVELIRRLTDSPKFIRRFDIGFEYFEGDLDELIKLFDFVIDNNNSINYDAIDNAIDNTVNDTVNISVGRRNMWKSCNEQKYNHILNELDTNFGNNPMVSQLNPRFCRQFILLFLQSTNDNYEFHKKFVSNYNSKESIDSLIVSIVYRLVIKHEKDDRSVFSLDTEIFALKLNDTGTWIIDDGGHRLCDIFIKPIVNAILSMLKKFDKYMMLVVQYDKKMIGGGKYTDLANTCLEYLSNTGKTIKLLSYMMKNHCCMREILQSLSKDILYSTTK